MTSTVDTVPIIVHIFGQTPHHYVPMKAFFEKVAQESTFKQQFWAWLHPEQSVKGDFTYYPNGKALLGKMANMPKSTRFVFHGMFDRSLWPFLLISPLTSRSVWVCWGAEVYQHKAINRTYKRRIAYYFHKFLVRRFFAIYALNSGDAELIKKVLWDVPVNVLPYPLIGSDVKPTIHDNSHTKTILVGNSAGPTNEHSDALNWLAKFANEPIQIVAPLNYAGPEEYVKKVINLGKQLFGEKFVPITQMLDKNEYDQLLASADVAVFAHHRQQGLYVVYSVLKYGRKMYLRGTTSSFLALESGGFDIWDSEQISKMSFEQFIEVSDNSAKKNAYLMNKNYSEHSLLPKWKGMLERLSVS